MIFLKQNNNSKLNKTPKPLLRKGWRGFLFLFLFCSSINAQQAVPHKQQFLDFWAQFKTALKYKDAEFVYNHLQIPFDSEGGYFNPEATLQEVKENYQQIIPVYRKEMEFVRFDQILLEKENAYIWLGYSTEDETYFYCYKKMSPMASIPSMEEKYWFVRLPDGKFKFSRVTAGVE